VGHLHSHSNLPGSLTDGNVQAGNLVPGLALDLSTQTATSREAAQQVMLCSIKMLQPCVGNFTLPGNRLQKSLNYVSSVSHVCHKHLRGLTPGAFGLESCGRLESLMFPPLASGAMFMCQWTIIQVISMPPYTLVRPLSMSSLTVWLLSLPWVNPNSQD
jgi:hypothetical protein